MKQNILKNGSVNTEFLVKKYIALTLLFIFIVEAFAALSSAEIYQDDSNGYYLDDFEGRNLSIGISTAIDTLIHEWAHCRVDWDEGAEHSDRWGVEYARIRRKLIDEEK